MRTTSSAAKAAGLRLSIVLLSCLALAGNIYAAPATRTAAGRDRTTKPNIVLILADDLGWTDLSCTGSGYYETPNIDQLARQGMRFTQFYVSQNCAPTRACLMSGQYAPRTGVYTVGELTRGSESNRKMIPPPNNTSLPLDQATVADALKAAGYATGMFGKWHLGAQERYHPIRRGFDEAIVSMGRHYNFKTDPHVEGIPEDAYLADFLTDRAVDFIARHKDRPFFLYLPHFAVHVPLEAKPELTEKFKNKAPAGGHNNPVYAAMIASLDQSVGRVLAALDQHGLADNTVVIFTSDNGGVGGYQAAGIKAGEITDNTPLRAGKGTLYEGGIRVPFFVRYPRLVKPGTVCHQPAIHVDILPTFVDLAGGQLPDQPLDGLSIVNLFKDPQSKLQRDGLFWHFPGYLEGKEGDWRTTPVGVIRAGDFKLMEYYETGALELYNINDDIGEKHNLADQLPDKTRQLHDRLKSWRKSLNAAMPKLKNPASRPAAGTE
jgi:arylsulfatase A-like enzyme